MDPPPFNFNTASTSDKPQPASGVFGSTVPKATFGSLFAKPSILGHTVHAEAKRVENTNETLGLAPSSSLASRLTIPPKRNNFPFKGQRDTVDSKSSNLEEGEFANRIRPKVSTLSKDSYLDFRKGREDTIGETDKFSNSLGNEFGVKPVGEPYASKVNDFQPAKRHPEVKHFFGRFTASPNEEGKNEVDHAIKKDGLPSIFGVPIATSSVKGIGATSTFQDRVNLPFKSFGERPWKPTSRLSPTAEGRQYKAASLEESKLIQKIASLKGQSCPGDYEKYMLLDERDKILCQLRKIGSTLIKNLERCEEMCTEKERYQRIVQKGVSPFECDVETGEVSHEMMVKQYARSAADQERPLPHELRSEKIMNHAMCYLLHNILDEFPDSSEQRAAWYNFLWNRTRALRKEVTQLSLSDTLALNLVERCTRLHILFGYVLCDLETEYFDAAMNNETLGKCLQTLRHFYEDFEKKGIPCVNEPEFRSYDVMLYMNDTNVLSQVLSYRNEVRQSPAVRLALQLATAFRDKNYCRFFRLLQTQASYLQCCVAHKLFASTRSNAMSIMANSYGRNAFPLDKLQRILGFDSIEDVKTMVNIYGFRTEENDYVMLSKDDFTPNETVPLRLYQWIDKKKNGKLSQVVYGPDLFQFIASRCDVSNSFNHRNEYRSDTILDMVLNGSEISSVNYPSALSFPQPSGSLTIQASMEMKKKLEAEKLKKAQEDQRDMLIERLIINVIDTVVQGLVEEEVMKVKIVRKQLLAMEKNRKIKEEQERIRIEYERKRKEKEKIIAENLAMKMEKEVLEDELKQIVLDEVKRKRRERERELSHDIVGNFWKDFLKSIDRHVKSVCEEMVHEKAAIMQNLAVFRDRVAKQWLLQFWNRWREWVQMKRMVKARKLEMIRRCAPRWESEHIVNSLANKYGDSNKTISSNFSFCEHPTKKMRLIILQKNRQHRIVRDAFRKWKKYSQKRIELKHLAEEKQKREQQFLQRFEERARIESRYKFDAPNDWMKKQLSKDEEDLALDPANSACDKPSFQFPDNNTLDVARRHLEEWEPEAGLPNYLREKIKRKRESFEKICEDYNQKKKRDEDLISNEAKDSLLYMNKLSGEADSLLDETLRYTTELDELMADIKTRRVDVL